MILDYSNDAKYSLAKCYKKGNGIKEDKEKAYDLNFIIDSYLGEMYFYGLGTEIDKKKEFELLDNAWNSGFVKPSYKTIKKY